ncbi:hypothetical protein L7F22_017428 [Adiantum nelumboides]|nr:hypothetical protein [Adiantum nelumboides]
MRLTSSGFAGKGKRVEAMAIRTKEEKWFVQLKKEFVNACKGVWHLQNMVVAFMMSHRVEFLCPKAGAKYDKTTMDSLDCLSEEYFQSIVQYTIFPGFKNKGSIVVKSHVYLKPKHSTVNLDSVEENRHSSTARNVIFCLNKEELQQEDWRSRYIQLLSRSQKWEKTLQLKDSTVQYLREALQDREIALKRQEKLIEETKQRLDFQGKSEKAHLEKKELEVSLLRAKAIRQAEKLAEQNKLISVLNSQRNKREQEFLNYSNNVQRKVDKLQVRLRSVEVSSQSREEELEACKKCCNDLKIIIWKKDRMLEKHKHTEEQIKSNLKRKHINCETLEAANNKLCGQNSHLAKKITEMKRNSEACETALQQNLEMQAFCLQKQKDQICRLEMILRQKDSCLLAKSKELEDSYKERERLVEEYDTLNRKFKALTLEHAHLQMVLDTMEEKMNMSHTWSMGKDNFLHREMPEQTTVSAQYGGIGLDQSNLIPRFDKNESSTSVEAYLATKGQSCLDAVSTPALPQNFSRPGVSQVAIEARPRRYVSGFEEDRQNPPNQLEPKTELTANLCNLKTLDSFKGDCSFPGIPLTCFPKSVGTGRNKWRVSDQVFILAEDNSCMEIKAGSKSTTNAVQSSTSSELQKIQEEIEEREIRWKQLETSMRADLNRRKLQLHEANIL